MTAPDSLKAGTRWACNGDTYVLDAVTFERPDGDQLRAALHFGPSEPGGGALPTFAHWRYRRTIHIDGQAWEILNWHQAIPFHGSPTWEFLLARMPDHDRQPADLTAKRHRARLLWWLGLALWVASLAGAALSPALRHYWLDTALAAAGLVCFADSAALSSWMRGYAAGTGDRS